VTGDDCGLCWGLGKAGCDLFGGEFCDLLADLETGRIPPDEFIVRHADLCTAEQAEAIRQALPRYADRVPKEYLGP
jgi:hypothetical protein